jgi:hypothetical protein
MRRRRDPRVIVLVVAALAVVVGLVVGMVARWPTTGVVLAFVVAGVLAFVLLGSATAVFVGVSTRVRDLLDTTRTAFDADPTDDAPEDGSVESKLRTAGLVDGEEARLSADFEREWRRRIVSMDGREGDESALASLLCRSEAEVDLSWQTSEGALVASVEERRAGAWPSRAAFVADVTAVSAFRELFPEWWSLSPTMRTRALGALRLCLDWCPACDGPIRIERLDAAPDRDRPPVLASTCEACDARLFEAELEPLPIDAPEAAPDAEA